MKTTILALLASLAFAACGDGLVVDSGPDASVDADTIDVGGERPCTEWGCRQVCDDNGCGCYGLVCISYEPKACGVQCAK